MGQLKDTILEELDLNLVQKANLLLGKSLKDVGVTDAQASQAIQKGISELTIRLQNDGLDAAGRYDLLREELGSISSSVPGMDDLLDSIDNAGSDVQNALANAVTYNSEFTTYIIDKLNSGDSSITGALKDIDPQARGPMADILNRVAADGRDGKTGQKFEKLDTALEAFQEYVKLEQEIADALKADPKADVSELNEKLKAQREVLFTSIEDAGGNIPALAHFDISMIFKFIGDVFNKGPEAAIESLVEGLKLDPNSKEAAAIEQVGGMVSSTLIFLGGEKGSGGYADLVINAQNGKYGDIGETVGDLKETFTTIAGGNRVGFNEPTAAHEAAEVTAVDDTIFTQQVAEELRGLPVISPSTIFGVMKEFAPEDSHAEIEALQQQLGQDVVLSDNFHNAALGLNADELAKIANDTYNGLEQGQTPIVAAKAAGMVAQAPGV